MRDFKEYNCLILFQEYKRISELWPYYYNNQKYNSMNFFKITFTFLNSEYKSYLKIIFQVFRFIPLHFNLGLLLSDLNGL